MFFFFLCWRPDGNNRVEAEYDLGMSTAVSCVDNKGRNKRCRTYIWFYEISQPMGHHRSCADWYCKNIGGGTSYTPLPFFPKNNVRQSFFNCMYMCLCVYVPIYQCLFACLYACMYIMACRDKWMPRANSYETGCASPTVVFQYTFLEWMSAHM